MKEKYNLNFHQTFLMDLQYISYILNFNSEKDGDTKEEISEKTGIPTGKSSGKVEPHIKYAKYCNLISYKYIKGKYFLNRTELGELIKLEDKFLKEEVTKELLLYFITSKNIGADQWSFFIRELLSEKEITKELVDKSLERRYPNTKKISNRVVIKTLEELNGKILKIEDNTLSKNNKRASRELKYVYAYTLLFEIEETYGLRNEITYNELEEIKWKEGHFLSNEDIYKVLEWLEELRIIKLNKQLFPVTIVKLKSSKDILRLIYSELI